MEGAGAGLAGAARPEVAPPGDRCALGGLRPGPARRRGAAFPLSGRGRGRRRAALAPATPEGPGSGEPATRAAGPAPESLARTAPVTAQTPAGQEAPRHPQAPGSVLAPGSRKPPRTSADRSSDLHSPAARLEARAAARAERLTWARCAAATAPATAAGAAPPSGRARADPSVSLCARRLVGVQECPALSPVGSRPPGLGAGAKPALPTPTGLVPQGLLANSAAPRGARGKLVALGPSSSSSSRKAAVTLPLQVQAPHSP